MNERATVMLYKNAGPWENVYQTRIKTLKVVYSSTYHIIQGTPPQRVSSANVASIYFTRLGSLPYGG